MAFALLASPALAARGGVLPLSADDGWLQFGNFVVLLFASAALVSVCAYALRSLSRRPILFLVMFSVSSLVATIVADKTNGVNNLPPMPPRECKGESVKCKMRGAVIASTTLHSQLSTLHSSDVARGWRVECVTTNETISYTMPSNAVYVNNWHVHGASSSFGYNVVNLGGVSASDWSFPLGTNGAAFSSFWYFVDGRIRPNPKDATQEICAVGVPMSAVPGKSRLWAIADGDSRVLTWENFFLGGDTNAPVNAQIRLFANGDFTTRSNNVETVCRRVNPDDWDGDGLANEKDENPLAYDGEFFGAANAMPTNANLDAYYQLDVAAAGALDFATIRVICDGPSDLGDHVIIARTNQVCHVPLLAGATYAVESDLPIAYSAVSSEHAHIVTNSITNLTVSLPLVFTVERIEMRGGGSDSYTVQTSPINVGPRVVDVSGVCCSCTTNETGFTWNCLPNCICGGSSHAISVFANWFGYSHPFTWWGRCHCYYEDQTAIDEIEGRGVGLDILDALGNAIEWKNPVLVGESVIVEATVGGSEMTVSGFAGLFDGRIRLKAYYVDADGEHDIVGAAIPISAENVTSRGQNVFRVSVTAEWLQSTGIVRNAADGIASKTSIDMSAADAGESNRQDSDIFDAQMSGRLYGRARGGENGNEMAAIPEGCLNQKTFKAGGTGILRAMCGLGLSNKCQVQQQADMIFYSGHGGHESAMLVGNVHPSILNPHWTNINAVVLSGCAVLDIANYRQQSFGWKSSLRWRMHGGANSPGEVWESLDVGILLGFAWTAPLDDAGGVAMVQSFVTSASSGMGLIEAWRNATDSGPARNACAIDKTVVPHVYWFWDEQSGVPVWTNAVKTAKGWEER